MAKILLIEPDIVLAKTLIDYLNPGHSIAWSHDGHHAIELLDKKPFDLIITEHNLPAHNSFEFLYELRSYPEWQALPIILWSKSRLPDHVLGSDSWQQLGKVKYLYKPNTSLALLASTVNRLALIPS